MASTSRAFYGKPLAWLVFALAMLAVPALGFMAQRGMNWEQIHPAVNAMLNGSSALFLVIGFIAIKRKNVSLHRECMVAAFTASSLFLASYLARFALSGTHRYPGVGWDKTLYLIILFSHMVLAVVLVPMVLRALYLGWRKRFDDHRKIARWTWPVWMYVSITGVIVYLMLYPIANALY
jgi:putative membrane protein